MVYLQRWHGWCHMKLHPSRRVLCTQYNHAPCHFIQSHIRKVYACLAVTCHLHLWQSDLNLLRATVVTRGWNGYRNKSQHSKSTMEKNLRSDRIIILRMISDAPSVMILIVFYHCIKKMEVHFGLRLLHRAADDVYCHNYSGVNQA